jgi:hyperosmotically inducible periplasmic protein
MKKQLIATLLASAAGSSFAFAPTAALNHDPATYRNVTQKASADYKSATAKCTRMSGNDKEVCMAEAKAARAHAEADAVAQYNNTAAGREKARIKLADADFTLAKARCDAKSGVEKDDCLNNAKSVHTAALADAKAGRDTTVAATGSSTTSTTVTGDARAQAAADQCARMAGSAKTACLIDNKAPVTAATGATTTTGAEMANRTENAAATAANKTRSAAATAAEKTKELAKSAAEKTKEVASTVAQKTENAMDRAGEKTRETASTAKRKTENALDRAGDKTRETASTAAHRTENAMDRAGEKTHDTAATVAHKTDRATDKTERVASDSAITTKVKAFMFKEPDLKSLAIHVKTEQGVVMLSGFVDSKAEADKAVEVAKSVDGVTTVKSAIKVK